MKYILFFFGLWPVLLSSQNNEIAFKSYTINGNFCKGIQTHYGSLLFIPENAFITEDNSDCTGIITIKYREFHSQTDMYYAKLNMIYEDGKRFHLLESVGMFEIEAWCGDKKLKLKENKQIQVRMKTRRNLKDLFSFIYNPKKNTWTKYESSVVDFSFFDKKNNADSAALWGSARVSPEILTMDAEMEGVYNPVKYFNKLPEGYFKGMNIKEMGIFNYDGVIKDSLAIPMQPELFVRGTETKLEQKVYVTYPNKNMLVYYYPHDFKENFVLLNVKGIKLFTEFSDGTLAITKDEEVSKLSLESYRGKVIKLVFDKIPAKPKNEKELAAATGLKTE